MSEPLSVHPASEVFTLDDDVARERRERAAGLDEAVAAMPPGVPYRAPARIDRIQLILGLASAIAPTAEGTGRQAARSSTSPAPHAAARALVAHTPVGCTSRLAVVGGRKSPCTGAYSWATATPSRPPPGRGRVLLAPLTLIST